MKCGEFTSYVVKLGFATYIKEIESFLSPKLFVDYTDVETCESIAQQTANVIHVNEWDLIIKTYNNSLLIMPTSTTEEIVNKLVSENIFNKVFCDGSPEDVKGLKLRMHESAVEWSVAVFNEQNVFQCAFFINRATKYVHYATVKKTEYNMILIHTPKLVQI